MEPERTFDVTFVAPLEYFHTDVEQLSIGEEVVLRRASDEDKQFLGELVGSVVLPRHALPEFDFALETRLLSPDRTTDAHEASERFARVVTAFRLIKAGAFGLPVLLAWQTESRIPRSALAPFRPRVAGKPYSFGKQDADELQNVMQQLRAARLNDRQNVALRRFDMAYERGVAEDRLIDCWVGLEALFSPSDRGELSYRIALRAAYFIASSPEEREQIYIALRHYYDTRSDIIHGRKPKQDVEVAAGAVEDYLRKALKKIVSDPTSFRPDELDLVVARGQFQQGAR